jgi:hypothetical protein
VGSIRHYSRPLRWPLARYGRIGNPCYLLIGAQKKAIDDHVGSGLTDGPDRRVSRPVHAPREGENNRLRTTSPDQTAGSKKPKSRYPNLACARSSRRRRPSKGFVTSTALVQTDFQLGRNLRVLSRLKSRGFIREASTYDPKIAVRRIPALFTEGEPEDRQAAQPRRFQVACRRREA